uniref:Uncharacterized protein n=1 Tax=Guillardia theta TaxID=55529 RepID=A0A7S4UA87_GUITH|mmetsp:Transcript_4586/g.16688  ORF Transcript_4586/g.16688 Transcript_4586/m.16688 type:complete len:337 (+) Transcript_4586:1283-2293(+)
MHSQGCGQIIQTMELKQYFPSAIRRIALLEEEIANIRNASLIKAAQEDANAAGQVDAQTSHETVDEEDEDVQAHDNREDNNDNRQKVDKRYQALVSYCKDAAKMSSEMKLESTKQLLQSALDLVNYILNEQITQTGKSNSPECDKDNEGAAVQDSSFRKQHDLDPQISAPQQQFEGIANWLVIASTGRLSIGDQLPSSWDEGLHFTCGVDHSFSLGELVLAFRSNGCRTLAKVERVSKTSLDLQVGRALQKTVALEKVGKLHGTLQTFIQTIFKRRDDGKKRSENNSKGHIEEQLSDALRKRNNGTIDDFDLDVDQELIEKLKDLELQEIARKSKN